MQDKIILCLGTNIGDRSNNLNKAIKYIQDKIGVLNCSSPIYESEPWGYSDSVHFFNQVIGISSELLPHEILQECLKIESEMGRKRTTTGYESRIIDIDILFYGPQCVEMSDLIIPHPRLHLRKFVLLPLKDILPGFIHPLLKKTIHELYLTCDDNSKVKKIL
jgi:2-amino-4-hydroxy-6-hydroxymethyldihydropteridine diphosphokinase